MRFNALVTLAIVACKSISARPAELETRTLIPVLPDSAYTLDPTAESALELKRKFEEKDKSFEAVRV